MTGFDTCNTLRRGVFPYITSTLGVFLCYLHNDYQYSWMDSNHLKAANLAEKVYKTSLTTKSHEQ